MPLQKTNQLIVFSGTDGAGKSTQIERLRVRMQRNEVPVLRIWSRGGYTPGMELLKSLGRFTRRFSRARWQTGNTNFRETSEQKPASIIWRTWLFLACLDLVLYWAVYIRLQLLCGKTVICDRYLFDTQLDFERKFPTIAFQRWLVWRTLCYVTPVPDVTFLLFVDAETSQERSRQKNDPFPDSIETLQWRLKRYLEMDLTVGGRILQIDCRREIDTIQTLILQTIATRKCLY